jgi:(E)-4-hydroxy-3-methylbut-2-enyl-diphosphate synthase
LLKVDNETTLKNISPNIFPLVAYTHPNLKQYVGFSFVQISASDVTASVINDFKSLQNKVFILTTNNTNGFAEQRSAILRLMAADVKLPVVIERTYHENDLETFQIKSSADTGGLLLDGLCDGIWLRNTGTIIENEICKTAFSILQASRMRISKTEYISCPSCGRTQFDIQSTTRKIRSKTAHLKGLKIGVMGCIVNGIGEMADADYGYVGGAPGKITLYHHKEVVQRGVPEDLAVDKLVELIKQNGDWVEPIV